MNFSTGMRDELHKIAMDDEAKLRMLAALRTTGAAALGTGLGYAAHGMLRGYAAQRLGQEGAKAIATKALGYGAIPMALGLGVMGTEAALRHYINRERDRYIEQRQSTDMAERMEADINFGLPPNVSEG